ncbi:MAG TPA: erythromycin esterase family protein [Allocoleopsis sp.]
MSYQEWERFVRNDAKEIISGKLDDFSDLQFLKSEIGDKRIVWLGESSHNIKEIAELKFRIIRFLNKEMGFKTVVFESGFAQAYISNIAKNEIPSEILIYTIFFPIWCTSNNIDMLNYFRNNNMNIAGLDPNCSATKVLPHEVYSKFLSETSQTTLQLQALDSLFMIYTWHRAKYFQSSKFYQKKQIKSLEYDRIYLQNAYIDLFRKIHQDYNFNNSLFGYQHSIWNNLLILNKKNDTTQVEDFFLTNAERDSISAINLSYIYDSLFPGEKVIVWAHNGHITKERYRDKKNNVLPTKHSIGHFLKGDLDSISYRIAIYGFPSRTKGKIVDKSYEFRELQSNSPYEITFFSLQKYGVRKMFDRINLNENYPFSNRAYNCFDGIFYLRNVTRDKLIPLNN